MLVTNSYSKFFFSFFVILVISVNSFAQEKTWNVAFEVAPSITKDFHHKNNDFVKQELKTAISYSIMLHREVSPKVAFDLGIKMLMKGKKLSINESSVFQPTSYILNGKSTLNFVSFPIGLRMSLSDNLQKGWYVKGNFQPAVFVSNQTKTTFVNEDETFSVNTQPSQEDAAKLNWFINIGTGYSFLIKQKLQLSIEPHIELMLFDFYANRSFQEANARYHAFGFSTRLMVLD